MAITKEEDNNLNVISNTLSGTTGGALLGSSFGIVGSLVGGIIGGAVTGYSAYSIRNKKRGGTKSINSRRYRH
ncbi:hypothetical protein [Mucilaginibacter arboris]|uniref:Glycine zipper domain-containing protein n=1 Tax=Mucilaginibacter arboris TaxID=2682090 RepID=A0A7K1SZJ3_9SPHI|nr:hypothetical protein [Mucilaginibacter arboris]MVN22678.1 hypothetical protein [Mucilaginibacter arboris]